MSLEKIINDEMKSAMLAKDSKRLEALRAIKAALLIAKTGKDVAGGEIPESVELQTLQRLVKQRKESAAIYEEKGRPELAEEELYQAEIIGEFLPDQASEDEIREAVKAAIEETSAEGMKDMGRIMGMMAKKFTGRADNRLISQIVKDQLSS